MKTLPLLVLAYEGPQARAYLAAMRRSGWRPLAVLLLCLTRHPATGKPVGRLIPGLMKPGYLEKSQEMALMHWPRVLRDRHPDFVAAMGEALKPLFEDAPEFIHEISGRFVYERYAERVERAMVERLNDPRTGDELSNLVATLDAPGGPLAVLYTGGGILGSALLDLSRFRFLHVHPGHLPEIRGADGLLWSLLIRGHPGASCLYMDRGIDTGNIVVAEDFDAMPVKLKGIARPDPMMLYRSVFSFYDPLLRAKLLVSKVLREDVDPVDLPAMPQAEADGRTYHFMHPKLRDATLGTLFP